MGKQQQVWIIGASGYSGAELCRMVVRHPHLQLVAAFANSAVNAAPLTDLYPQYHELTSATLQLWDESWLQQASDIDIVFLALPHEASLALAPKLLASGCLVIDLSGAFRLTDLHNYPDYYGFAHDQPNLIDSRYYALPHGQASHTSAHNNVPSCLHHSVNANSTLSDSQLLSMPGCYPTAATLALAPLLTSSIFLPEQMPVVTAVSGVSGAGRKANLNTSFCEVSLRPYGVLQHRHQCEIAQNIGQDLIFVPQLGNFKRGIIATCVARVKPGTDKAQLDALYGNVYGDDVSIRLRHTPPQVDDVANTPFCDLHISVQGDKVVVIAAIDNLLKGAASQAIEACNLKHEWARMEGVL